MTNKDRQASAVEPAFFHSKYAEPTLIAISGAQNGISVFDCKAISAKTLALVHATPQEE
jgi:hypothetical protein